MLDRATVHPKIEMKMHRQVKTWLSDDNGLTGAILEDPRDGSTEEIAVTGAFIAIGHKPITKFLDGQVETDESGYIVAKEHTMTSVPGVFAAGDVVDTRYRQAITAAGMGCQAAIDVEHWLEDNIHN
jgi:thioredoxin reductase (NADPH)